MENIPNMMMASLGLTLLMSLVIDFTEAARDAALVMETEELDLSNTPMTGPTPIRLVRGANASQGRLEVFHNDEWGTVCEEFSDRNHVPTAICRMLGFVGGIQNSDVARPGDGMKIWLDRINCPRHINDITECMTKGWRTHSCWHFYDLRLQCTPTKAIYTKLVGGVNAAEGRLEVRRSDNNTWGTVCDDFFYENDANSICQMMGFLGGVVNDDVADVGSGPIWLDNLNCPSAISDIGECMTNDWGEHNCWHNQDVRLKCDTTKTRLVEGATNTEGRLEVFYGGVWGTVCNQKFTLNNANAICKMIGFNGGFLNEDVAPDGNGTIWLNELACPSSLTSIDQCNHQGWGVHYCRHYHDIRLQCFGHNYDEDDMIMMEDEEEEGDGEVTILDNDDQI